MVLEGVDDDGDGIDGDCDYGNNIDGDGSSDTKNKQIKQSQNTPKVRRARVT